MELLFLLILMLLMAGALSSGFPVAFALPGSAILTIVLAGITGYIFTGDSGAYFAQDGPIEWLSAGVTNFRGIYWEVERDTLIAIPLFVFMGIMLQRSKIAEDLLVAMAQLFGPIPGGLGISVVFVGGLLAATTGIVGATVVAMGLISLPAMMRNNYSPQLATGTICASGTLGQIIPPSIVLIILADQLSSAADQASSARQAAYRQATGSNALPSHLDVSSASAGDMFLGALIPGLILIGIYMLYILVFAAFKPKSAPPVPYEGDYNIDFVKKVLLALLPPLFLIFAVLGSIIAGIATVNQAGSIGAIGAIMMAGYRLYKGKKYCYYPAIIAIVSVFIILLLINNFDLNIKNIHSNDSIFGIILAAITCLFLYGAIGWSLWRIYKTDNILTTVMIETAKLTSMVFIILLGAAMLTAAFRAFGGEEIVRHFLTGLPGGFWGQFFVVMAVIFVLGFFLDFIEIAVVVVPIVAPILLSDPEANITAVWFGVMVGLNIQTSFLTPPFGFALFYLRSVAGKAIQTLQIYRGVVVFIGLQLLALVIVGYYPSLVNYLPKRLNLTSQTAPPPKNPALQQCLEEYLLDVYSREEIVLNQAIYKMNALNLSELSQNYAKKLKVSFDKAGQSYGLLQNIMTERQKREDYAIRYRPIHQEARAIEAKIRKIEKDIIAYENRNDLSPQDNENMALLIERIDELKALIPANWQQARQQYVDLTKNITTAQRKYQRNVDDSYQTIIQAINVINAAPVLQKYIVELEKLAVIIDNESFKDAGLAIKNNQSLLNNIADSSKIRSLLSKARKDLKKKKKARAMKNYQKALDMAKKELLWRSKAQTNILLDLQGFEQSIRHHIGVRSQKRLNSEQAADVASCLAHHRDISLEF